MRVDNGAPWGTSRDLPPELALWLIGLGIEMIWNPPRRPQDNGVVERSQGTGKRWSEPKTCSSADELQSRIDADDRRQREVYPGRDGRTRLAAHPHLRRPASDWRRRPWSLHRVLEHLADYVLPRRVDRVGNVSIYGRNVYLGKRAVERTTFVTLDPESKEWIIEGTDGSTIARKPAVELTAATIKRLRLLDDERRRRHAAKRYCHSPPAQLPRR